MSVYGSFIDAFPELMETFEVWNKPDKSDVRIIRGIYIPEHGSNIDRKRLADRATWGLDIKNDDLLFVHKKYSSKIKIGDYTRYDEKDMLKVVGDMPYIKPADFIIFKVERVQGADPTQTEDLVVNKPVFR